MFEEETPITDGQATESQLPVDGAVDAGQETPTSPVVDATTQKPAKDIDAPDATAAQFDPQAAWENQWLRGTVQQLAQQLQQAQQELQNYTLAGMDETERQAYLLQQKEQQLTAEQQSWQENIERQQWLQYYTAYLPKGSNLVGANPVEWGHHVITTLHAKNQQLEKDLTALKAKLTTTTPVAPKLASTAASPLSRKRPEQFSLKDIQQIQEQALLGSVDPNQFPSII